MVDWTKEIRRHVSRNPEHGRWAQYADRENKPLLWEEVALAMQTGFRVSDAKQFEREITAIIEGE